MADHLQGLTAFMGSTAPDWASDPLTFFNMATEQNYETLGYFLRGRPYADVFKTGTELRDRVLFEETPRMRSYLIGEDQDTVVTQPGTTLTSYFRFFMTDMSWFEEPLIMNAGSSASEAATKNTWKNLWKQMWADNYTDQMNYWERYLWRAPVAADDTAAGTEFLSVPSAVNEYTFGQFLKGEAGVSNTCGGVNGETVENHRPRVGTYTNFTPRTALNVVEGLDDLMLLTKFKPPPMHQEYFNPEDGIDQSGGFIACSRSGRRKLTRTYRDSNDTWVDKTDPFMNPTFAGAPIVYVAALDSAALYPNVAPTAFTRGTVTAGGTGVAVAEGDAGSGATFFTGPRYYLLQSKGYRVHWHQDRFMERLKPINDRVQPTKWTQFINTFGTAFPRGRRCLGLLAPTTNDLAAA